MSIKGFSVGGVVQRYDYTALDNLPQGQGVSDDLKAALLQLAQKVAYIGDQGQTYYNDLYDALYPEKTLLSIAANFQQGQAVVYNTDSLDSLKQYLTVTAIYDDASTETVPSSAYTLSGTLTTGTSVITVTYEGKTDAFNVVVTAAPMSFTVTNSLTGCTTSNSATAVLENTSYTAVITASSGYTLVGATVSITMGGNDITTSAYSGGIITINSVTGALVISVAAMDVVLNSISAVYTQSGTVYDTDTLDSLKADLVVTAHYSDSSTQTVSAADYTLSGTLTAGTSTITVAYGGKTTTISVTVTHSEVPAGYTMANYIENPNQTTSAPLVNTGVTPSTTGNLEVDIDFMMTSTNAWSSTPNEQYKYILAINVGTGYATAGACIGVNPDNYTLAAFNGAGSTITPNGTSSVLNQRLNISATFTSSGSSVTDGTHSANESGSGRNHGNPIYLYGLKVRPGGTVPLAYFMIARIYGCTVRDNGTEILKAIPCIRNSDNAAGFWDKVNENFITASGLVAG